MAEITIAVPIFSHSYFHSKELFYHLVKNPIDYFFVDDILKYYKDIRGQEPTNFLKQINHNLAHQDGHA